MTSAFADDLVARLQGLKPDGLYREEQVIASPQQGEVRIEGGAACINLCANNYLGVFASVPGALTRREQLMSSRGSCIGYKGGRAGREAVQALVRARPSRSLARAVIGV